MRWALSVTTFFLVVCFKVQTVHGQNLAFTATPKSIVGGFNPTQNIQITCAHTVVHPLGQLTIGRLTRVGNRETLVLFKTGDDQPKLQGSFAGKDNIRAIGSMSQAGFVTVSINNPGIEYAGHYYCIGHTVEGSIHPSLYQTLTIEHEPFDIGELVTRILDLTEAVNELKGMDQAESNQEPDDQYGAHMEPMMSGPDPMDNGMEEDYSDLYERIEFLANVTAELELATENARSQISDIEERAGDLYTDIVSTKCEIVESRTTYNMFLELHHTASNTYEDQIYLSSELLHVSFLKAEGICKSLGGSLAEIDTEEEFDFLVEFLEPMAPPNLYYLIGARSNGDGSYQYSNSDVTAMKFQYGRPDNRNGMEECVALVKDLGGVPGMALDDVPCDYIPYRDNEWQHNFICEIPVATSLISDDYCSKSDSGMPQKR